MIVRGGKSDGEIHKRKWELENSWGKITFNASFSRRSNLFVDIQSSHWSIVDDSQVIRTSIFSSLPLSQVFSFFSFFFEELFLFALFSVLEFIGTHVSVGLYSNKKLKSKGLMEMFAFLCNLSIFYVFLFVFLFRIYLFWRSYVDSCISVRL
jgi:hypothetical protein